jgi:GTPase involved in cell partitioning and DNA repair
VLAQLVDLAAPTPLSERVDTVRAELEAYRAPLHRRRWLLVGSKLDAVADRAQSVEELERVAARHGVGCCAISAVTGESIDRLVAMLFRLVEEQQSS